MLRDLSQEHFKSLVRLVRQRREAELSKAQAEDQSRQDRKAVSAFYSF